MVINLISGPRNISTALMYSFSQRTDTKVIDEPFYAHYLNSTGIDHPGREEILDNQENDPLNILYLIEKEEQTTDILFLKNMAHHHEVLEWNYLNSFRNVFLIRDPKQLIASFAQVIPNPSIQDIGLKHEAELLEYVCNNGQFDPIVIDSNTILPNPEKGLKKLCKQLGILFHKTMLSWEKGPIPQDGVWAKYWYKNVHDSTGFVRQSTSSRPLPKHCKSLYKEAMIYYERLLRYR